MSERPTVAMGEGEYDAPKSEWGDGLAPRYQHAVEVVQAEFAVRDDVLGIVLAGSLVRGDGGPTSDLDIFVVVSSPYRQRRQLWIDDVPVEIFLNPPWTIRSYFADELHDGGPATAHMLATGRVLFSRGPVLAVLRDEARQLLAKGREALSAEGLAFACYHIIDLAEDAEDARATDPETLAYLLPQLVEPSIALLYARARRWQPKPKRLPADLRQFDPESAALLRRYLQESVLAQRDALACALVDRAIAPLTRRFFTWETAPAHVPER